MGEGRMARTNRAGAQLPDRPEPDPGPEGTGVKLQPLSCPRHREPWCDNPVTQLQTPPIPRQPPRQRAVAGNHGFRTALILLLVLPTCSITAGIQLSKLCVVYKSFHESTPRRTCEVCYRKEISCKPRAVKILYSHQGR